MNKWSEFSEICSRKKIWYSITLQRTIDGALLPLFLSLFLFSFFFFNYTFFVFFFSFFEWLSMLLNQKPSHWHGEYLHIPCYPTLLNAHHMVFDTNGKALEIKTKVTREEKHDLKFGLLLLDQPLFSKHSLFL